MHSSITDDGEESGNVPYSMEVQKVDSQSAVGTLHEIHTVPTFVEHGCRYTATATSLSPLKLHSRCSDQPVEKWGARNAA